ncbi:unnamed protein product [Pseudo-nitzschia multistriata]|uniref:Uncharacterized protein n=1 Tax=Pseudo-nitzschia multistriata TaxID=183589 RepID=A0A448ZBC2_9STRA|nr:unnamed protein product [Pseudo-nitzschia multistriata]
MLTSNRDLTSARGSDCDPLRRDPEQKHRRGRRGSLFFVVSFVLVASIQILSFARFHADVDATRFKSADYAQNISGAEVDHRLGSVLGEDREKPGHVLAVSGIEKRNKIAVHEAGEEEQIVATKRKKRENRADAKNEQKKHKYQKKRYKQDASESQKKKDNRRATGPGDPDEGDDTEEKREGGEEKEDMYFRDPNAQVVDWDYFPKHEPRRDVSWTEAENSESSINSMDEEECEKFMKYIDTSPPKPRKASNKACEGYDGVLHISHFDVGAASGTAFFMFTIGMLAWADQHNYLPWIHIDSGYTRPIWDPIVHMNTSSADPVTFRMKHGMGIGWARDPRDGQWHIFPGKPYLDRPLRSSTYAVNGTGVWRHYFLPPNDFVPGDTSCRNKPIVQMDNNLIVPGIHSNAPYTPRAWRTTEADYLTRDDLSWDEWFEPQRKHGAAVTERYIRFNPMMERRARCAFPTPKFSLGMHIRHGDKAIERDIIETSRFLEFAKAFVNNGGGSIYVATDSIKVVETILQEWPAHVVEHIVRQSTAVALSRNETASFALGVSPHRSNIEALTDLLALSKCTFLLHGLSALSEAAFYLNPDLVARSINLEDTIYQEYHPDDFVRDLMPLGKEVSDCTPERKNMCM